jgi:hypothetical protein
LKTVIPFSILLDRRKVVAHSHLSQPLCDHLRVKPYTGADAERRNSACLCLLENCDFGDGQHSGEFVCRQSTADSLDSIRQ